MKKDAEYIIQGNLLLNDATQRFYRFPRELPFRVSIWEEGSHGSPCIVKGSSMIEIGTPCLVEVVIASQGQIKDVQVDCLLFIGVFPEKIGTLTVREVRDA